MAMGECSAYSSLHDCLISDLVFPIATARTWNHLPAEATSSNSLQTFKTKLKSYLFLASFP